MTSFNDFYEKTKGLQGSYPQQKLKGIGLNFKMDLSKHILRFNLWYEEKKSALIYEQGESLKINNLWIISYKN